jgi:hypothetical protein
MVKILSNVLFPILSDNYIRYIHLINFLVLVTSGILWFAGDTGSIPLLIADLVVLMFGLEQLYCFLKTRSLLLNIKPAE